MNASLPAIANVTARIDSIERRFDALRSPSPTSTSTSAPGLSSASSPLRVVDAGPAFEPFGDAYQRAVTAQTTGAPPSTMSTQPVPLDPSQRARWSSVDHGAFLTNAVTPTDRLSGRVEGTQRIGGYGPMPIPPELAAFGNGRIPAEQLRPITQSGHRLHAPAALAWDALVDAAAADGIDMRITDSYRSYEQQVDLVRRKGLYSEGGLGATPGTSNHGWGLAVDADVTDPAVLEWIRTNGPRFGWVEAVPREPWHWEFRPHQV